MRTFATSVMVWSALLFTMAANALAAEAEMRADEIKQRIAQSALQGEISAVLELELPNAAYAGLDDFDVAPADHASFAIDGAGGWYYVLGDGRILLVDSEGSAGVVASDFDAFLAMTTGLPGWRDALRYVGEPDVEAALAGWRDFARQWNLEAAMQRPWPYSPETFSIPTPGEARDAIRAEFGIPTAADPFATLYKAVNTLNGDVTVVWEGQPYLIFGRTP